MLLNRVSLAGREGAGRETLALGTSWSWELLLSLGAKPQFMDILSETVSKSVDTRRTVFFQSMKVDNNVKKV